MHPLNTSANPHPAASCPSPAANTAASLPAPAAGQGEGTFAEESIPVHMPVQLCTDCAPIDLWKVIGFVLLFWVGHFIILGVNEVRADQGGKK